MRKSGEIQDDPFPRRYNLVSGVMTETPLWKFKDHLTATINPEWRTAEYEMLSGALKIVNRMEEISRQSA